MALDKVDPQLLRQFYLKMTNKRILDPQHLSVVALLVLVGVLIYLLGPILTPFLFAAILAYICDPLVDKLQRRRVPRTAGVLLVMALLTLLFVGLILILIPLFEQEIKLFITRIPDYIDWFKLRVEPWLESTLGIAFSLDAAALKEAAQTHWKSAGDMALKALPSIKVGGLALLGFLMNLILVPIVLFYLLRDWDVLMKHVSQLIPRRYYDETTMLAREVDRVLGEFLRGQLLVMLLMAVFYVLGLWLVGLEFALPIGLIAGILVFIPYVGATLGFVLATLAALMQLQGLSGLIPVWIVFGLGQLIESFVVTPWLVGDRTGLHPVVVIFALMAFGQLFGFVGVLLALPASAALLVWLRHLRGKYLASNMYQS